jgi:uncharacterized protein YcnI
MVRTEVPPFVCAYSCGMNMLRGGALAAALVLALSANAGAHIRVRPSVVHRGAYVHLTFRVPNERAIANTTAVTVQFPPDAPIASATVMASPGWSARVRRRRVALPLRTPHGSVLSAVDTITWSGGAIPPGHAQTFAVFAGPMPATAGKLYFRTLQTYANGEVVRWIQVQHPGEPEPQNPAPTVRVIGTLGPVRDRVDVGVEFFERDLARLDRCDVTIGSDEIHRWE